MNNEFRRAPLQIKSILQSGGSDSDVSAETTINCHFSAASFFLGRRRRRCLFFYRRVSSPFAMPAPHIARGSSDVSVTDEADGKGREDHMKTRFANNVLKPVQYFPDAASGGSFFASLLLLLLEDSLFVLKHTYQPISPRMPMHNLFHGGLSRAPLWWLAPFSPR